MENKIKISGNVSVYYLQTADISITLDEAKKFKNKIEKLLGCYVMIKDENGEEV